MHQGIQRFRDGCRTSPPPKIEIVWKPYQIDPNIHIHGELFEDYCQRRWGGSEWTTYLLQQGRKEGCNFANWKYICNTLRAHQLILYGTKYHSSDACTTDTMNAALFQALYEEGLNISRLDPLVTIGSKMFISANSDTSTSGFNADHLRTYLKEHQGRTEVEDEMENVQQQYRVRGVPSFHVGIVESNANTDNNIDLPWISTPISFSGAQPADIFVEILQKLSSEM